MHCIKKISSAQNSGSHGQDQGCKVQKAKLGFAVTEKLRCRITSHLTETCTKNKNVCDAQDKVSLLHVNGKVLER